MSEFESIMRFNFRHHELGELALAEARLETAYANFTDSEIIDRELDIERTGNFRAAHQGGYANELYSVMKSAGLPVRYLTRISVDAFNTRGDK